MDFDAIVVGSGPSGVATASALLRRGRRVLTLDAGLRLEPERQTVVEQMAATDPSRWTPSQLATVTEGMEPCAKGIPLKRVFGSDFPFRETSQFPNVACRHSEIKVSFALGGFSNVWGAGAIPFCADDISDWPIRIEALAPFYGECLEEMHLAATVDALAQDYPLYTPHCRALRPSRQAVALLADLEGSRTSLEREGVRFGVSRLAVKTGAPDDPHGCVYCGLCLYGCPYGFIYNSAACLQSLIAQPRFSYQPDVVVERLEEAGATVTLRARGRQSGEELRFSARQAFLACGPVATTAILLDSLSAWGHPLQMKDSQYFICPVLRFRGTPDVEHEQLHTLAQVFLEIRDPAVSAKGIHLSVYTYNSLLLLALQKRAGVLGKLFPALPKALARRLLVFGGYLHSNESPSIEISLTRSPDQARRVVLRGNEPGASAQTLSRLMKKLIRNSLRFKALPLALAANRGLPGRGFHFGGTFPMSVKPTHFQSDLAGRPFGFSKVHIVDSTGLPSIPAPNLTLTVMANARRIAAAACQV